MTRILVVEDDAKLAKLLVSGFDLEGYQVKHAADGEVGLDLARTWKPDLVVLDIMLPSMSGYDVCRKLRKEGNETPILFLTAKGHETEKAVGLDFGADDYMTKPFSGIELMARVRALLRRKNRGAGKIDEIAFGDISVNFRKMEAFRGKKKIALTPKEFQILQLLVSHKGDVVTREQFYEEIWGGDEMPSTRTIDTQILSLRQKLGSPESGSTYITTVHGAGYKFTG